MVTGKIIEIFSILFVAYILVSNFGQIMTTVGTAENFIPLLSVAALVLLLILYAFNRFVGHASD